MVQLYLDGGALICGITRGNIERLTGGQPLRIVPRKPVETIFVMFGEDKVSILRQLKAAGMDVPDAYMEAVLADPA